MPGTPAEVLAPAQQHLERAEGMRFKMLVEEELRAHFEKRGKAVWTGTRAIEEKYCGD